MPRKSAESLGVVTQLPRRPEPPAVLTVEQAEEWRAVVGRLPPDWFKREIFPLLTQFCRHAVQCRHLDEMINKAHDDPQTTLADREKLLRMQNNESRVLAVLATKLRLTNQSRYTPHGAASAAERSTSQPKPWEL